MAAGAVRERGRDAQQTCHNEAAHKMTQEAGQTPYHHPLPKEMITLTA
jgi:hypothetical protein